MILIWSQKTKKPALGWSCRRYSVVGRMSPGGSRRSTSDHHSVTGRKTFIVLCKQTNNLSNMLVMMELCSVMTMDQVLDQELLHLGHGPPVCHSSLVSPGSSSITTEHPIRSMTTVVMHHGMFPWRHRIFEETLCV